MPASWRKLFAGIVAALVVGALLPAAHAERTRRWRQSTYEEFEKGTPKGVALRSDGKLVLAPRFAPFADPNAAYLRSLRADSKGNLYAAGGSNAKVVRVDAKGASTTAFEAAEMTAQAIALDAQDNLYVGTSPDGKVYKVTSRGEKSVFFEPKTKYIWDMALDADGTLYVATGDKGEIFAVKADGKGQLFYTGEETHIRALAFDAKGNLLAGTEPNGLVLRIAKGPAEKPEARRAFVLYEASKKEITALLVDRAGNIYAAAIGEKQRPAVAFPQMPIVPAQAAPLQAGVAGAATGQQTIPAPAPAPTVFVPFPPLVGGAVFRLTPDGAPEELWTSRDDLVYALGFSARGKLLLGTGNRGVLIELEGHNVFSNLAKTASSQVTGLAQGPDGRIFACTANPGKIFVVGPDDEPEGAFESQTFDARIFSRWGRLEWWGENGVSAGKGAPVQFYVRSGNTSNPEKNWSPWAGPYTAGKGEKVDVPPARFVQWKVAFRSQPGHAPNIAWVSLSYLPKNVAPVIDAVVVQNPGIQLQGFQGAPQGAAPVQPVQVKMPPPPASLAGVFLAQTQPQQAPPAARFDAPPQGFAHKGHQAVVWSAHDDNDDELSFSIYYRGEGEKNWKLLKEKLEHKFYSWDTTTMPDGAYYLKITASDAPSNPPEDALTAERKSDRFEVDNTPPIIESLRAEPASPDVRVRFDARDTSSAIARAEYSLDAGDWLLVFPIGKLTDAPQESYDLTLRGLAPGEHTLAVRVYDRFENLATSKVTFSVPPQKR